MEQAGIYIPLLATVRGRYYINVSSVQPVYKVDHINILHTVDGNQHAEASASHALLRRLSRPLSSEENCLPFLFRFFLMVSAEVDMMAIHNACNVSAPTGIQMYSNSHSWHDSRYRQVTLLHGRLSVSGLLGCATAGRIATTRVRPYGTAFCATDVVLAPHVSNYGTKARGRVNCRFLLH